MDLYNELHVPYAYMSLVEEIYAQGEIGPSRMGDLKQITNMVFSVNDVTKLCKMPRNEQRKENLDFIERYIDSTILGLPEKYMLELAPVNAKNLEQLDSSYGEILHKSYDLDWMNVRSNSKRQIRMLYNEETSQHNIPPCTMGFQFNSINGFLDMNVFSRSIDLFYGLTNDLVVFFALQDLVARRNRLIPRKFMMTFGNLHFYLDKGERIFDWMKSPMEETSCHCDRYWHIVESFALGNPKRY